MSCSPLFINSYIYCRQRCLAIEITCHAADWQFPGYGSREHSSVKATGSRGRPKAIRERVAQKRTSKKDVDPAKDQEESNEPPEAIQSQHNQALSRRRYTCMLRACSHVNQTVTCFFFVFNLDNSVWAWVRMTSQRCNGHDTEKQA